MSLGYPIIPRGINKALSSMVFANRRTDKLCKSIALLLRTLHTKMYIFVVISDILIISCFFGITFVKISGIGVNIELKIHADHKRYE